MVGDWIRLHRKVIDSQVFSDHKLLAVWIWCLCRANYKPRFVNGQRVEAGEFVTGKLSGAEELHMSPSAFYRALKKLESWGQIKLTANSKWTTVSICHWKTYQQRERSERTAESALPETQAGADDCQSPENIEKADSQWTTLTPDAATPCGEVDTLARTAGGQPADNERTTSGPPADTDKKDKKDKKGEECEEGVVQPQTHKHDGRLPSNLASHAQSGELHKLFFGWVEMVAQSEFRPMQPLRIDMILAELSNRAKSVPDAIEIVQRSIRKNATRDLYYEDLKFPAAEPSTPPEPTQPKIKRFISGVDKVQS